MSWIYNDLTPLGYKFLQDSKISLNVLCPGKSLKRDSVWPAEPSTNNCLRLLVRDVVCFSDSFQRNRVTVSKFRWQCWPVLQTRNLSCSASQSDDCCFRVKFIVWAKFTQGRQHKWLWIWDSYMEKHQPQTGNNLINIKSQVLQAPTIDRNWKKSLWDCFCSWEEN